MSMSSWGNRNHLQEAIGDQQEFSHVKVSQPAVAQPASTLEAGA